MIETDEKLTEKFGNVTTFDCNKINKIKRQAEEAFHDLWNQKEDYMKSHLKSIWHNPKLKFILRRFCWLEETPYEYIDNDKDKVITIRKYLKIRCKHKILEKIFLKI